MFFVNFKFLCNKISKKKVLSINNNRNEKLKKGEEWEFFCPIALNFATVAHLVGIFVLDIQIFHT